MRILALLVLCLLALPLSAAQYYKWVDAEGKVHFSDTPPPSGNYQSLSSADPQVQGEAPSSYQRAKALQEAQLQAQNEAAKQETAAQAAAERAAIRTENCRRARNNLETLETHTQLLVPPEDGEGEPTRMGGEERLRRLEAARAAVAEYCAPT